MRRILFGFAASTPRLAGLYCYELRLAAAVDQEHYRVISHLTEGLVELPCIDYWFAVYMLDDVAWAKPSFCRRAARVNVCDDYTRGGWREAKLPRYLWS